MIGDKYHEGVILRALLAIFIDDLPNRRIEHAFEIFDLVVKRVLRDVRIEIDARKIDHLQIRYAVLFDRVDDERNRFEVHLRVGLLLVLGVVTDFTFEVAGRERAETRDIEAGENAGSSIHAVERYE